MRKKNMLSSISILEKPKAQQTWGKNQFGIQICKPDLYQISGLLWLPSTPLFVINNSNKSLWKCNRNDSSPSNILFLQRISRIKNRKELPKQGSLGVFFKHFFKRIITTVLTSTNTACSFSSPSPGRLACVHSVLMKNFSSWFFSFIPPTPLNRNNLQVEKYFTRIKLIDRRV